MRATFVVKTILIVLSIAFVTYLFVCFSIGENSTFTEENDQAKKILYWNRMYDDETFRMGKGEIFHDCPVSNCYATDDRNYANLTDFDAILFHEVNLDVWDQPRARSPKQWYVFVKMASPYNVQPVNYLFEGNFNATMTYYLDSDIPWTYGIVRDKLSNETVAPLQNAKWSSFHDRPDNGKVGVPPIEIASKKKAIVSYPQDCEAKNGRAEYAAELSKHIDVDVYGECGNYNCSYGGDCFSKVFERDYYFYLSFESALCEDFVTEHLYNPLRYDIVPIVYGAANYSLFAPPQSYVNAFDFDTPEDLAKYLQWLIDHPDIYKKYFAWKQYYEIEDGTPRAICSLCKFLHEQREPKVYPILSRWSSVGKCPLQRLLFTHRYLTRHVLNKT